MRWSGIHSPHAEALWAVSINFLAPLRFEGITPWVNSCLNGHSTCYRLASGAICFQTSRLPAPACVAFVTEPWLLNSYAIRVNGGFRRLTAAYSTSARNIVPRTVLQTKLPHLTCARHGERGLKPFTK